MAITTSKPFIPGKSAPTEKGGFITTSTPILPPKQQQPVKPR